MYIDIKKISFISFAFSLFVFPSSLTASDLSDEQVAEDVKQGSIFSYLNPYNWSWFSASETPKEPQEDVVNSVVKNTQELQEEDLNPVRENREANDLAKVLQDYGLSQSVIYDVTTNTKKHVSLSNYFDEEDFLSINVPIGKHTVSVYEGATYVVLYKGKPQEFKAAEIIEKGKHFQTYARLIAVKKNGQIIVNMEDGVM